MEKSERRKILEQSIKEINKKSKSNIIEFGASAEKISYIPFGIPLLDDFVGGGFKQGGFTVIYGGEGTGKSTLVLQALAHSQKNGKICCYIDLENSFDRDRAISLGINLDDLVIVRGCKTAEESLSIIRKLCQDKVVDIFAIDSVQAMSPLNEQENKGKQRELHEKEIAELARTLSKFFKVVSPDIFRARASVLMIGQVRIGGIGSFFVRATMSGGEAIKHWASTRLFIRKGQTADAPHEKIKEDWIDPEGKSRKRTVKKILGFDSVIKIEKTRCSSGGRINEDIHIPFYFDSGFLPPKKQELKTIKVKTKKPGRRSKRS